MAPLGSRRGRAACCATGARVCGVRPQSGARSSGLPDGGRGALRRRAARLRALRRAWSRAPACRVGAEREARCPRSTSRRSSSTRRWSASPARTARARRRCWSARCSRRAASTRAVGGNLGTRALRAGRPRPRRWLVAELSSFQLEHAQRAARATSRCCSTSRPITSTDTARSSATARRRRASPSCSAPTTWLVVNRDDAWARAVARARAGARRRVLDRASRSHPGAYLDARRARAGAATARAALRIPLDELSTRLAPPGRRTRSRPRPRPTSPARRPTAIRAVLARLRGSAAPRARRVRARAACATWTTRRRPIPRPRSRACSRRPRRSSGSRAAATRASPSTSSPTSRAARACARRAVRRVRGRARARARGRRAASSASRRSPRRVARAAALRAAGRRRPARARLRELRPVHELRGARPALRRAGARAARATRTPEARHAEPLRHLAAAGRGACCCVGFGLVMVYSASAARAEVVFGTSLAYLGRQSLALAIGLALGALCFFAPLAVARERRLVGVGRCRCSRSSPRSRRSARARTARSAGSRSGRSSVPAARARQARRDPRLCAVAGLAPVRPHRRTTASACSCRRCSRACPIAAAPRAARLRRRDADLAVHRRAGLRGRRAPRSPGADGVAVALPARVRWRLGLRAYRVRGCSRSSIRGPIRAGTATSSCSRSSRSAPAGCSARASARASRSSSSCPRRTTTSSCRSSARRWACSAWPRCSSASRCWRSRRSASRSARRRRSRRCVAVGASLMLWLQALLNAGRRDGRCCRPRAARCRCVSYGGTSLVASLAAIGLILNAARPSKRGRAGWR